jgi:hypothetical protein
MEKIFTELLWPIIVVGIPVFATIYSAYQRNRNNSKESHKPYVVLENVKKLETINKYQYYLNIFGMNNANKKTENNIYADLELKNIGYGVATNIKFYDLFSSKQLDGMQEMDDKVIQKLFTTLDLGEKEMKNIEAIIMPYLKKEDMCKLICIYQDLNGNIYDLLINIDIQTNGFYDFSSYQRSSHSYKRTVSCYKKNYKKILKDYSTY